MAAHHVGHAFLAPGLSHADGHVMPLQRCVDVDVEGDTQTLNLIQKAGHLQNNHQHPSEDLRDTAGERGEHGMQCHP